MIKVQPVMLIEEAAKQDKCAGSVGIGLMRAASSMSSAGGLIEQHIVCPSPIPPGAGRIKAPPVCDWPEMKADSMSTADIKKYAFDSNNLAVEASQTSSGRMIRVASCCSVSDPEDVQICEGDSCEEGSKMILSQQVSRQGRDGQRWVKDEENRVFRLVTGCVPILRGGKIMFASASRKPEWILPKGGWEMDESMEVSALRETFEEAGVVGVLGPMLTQVTYETRKNKKRRLELEGKLEKNKQLLQSRRNGSSVAVSEDDTQSSTSSTPRKGLNAEESVSEARIRSQPEASDSSVVSDKAIYSHVKMTLIPLYVTEVKDKWPESGRFRKMMDIDDAIVMLESRPEFKKFLEEVKERGLHFPAENTTGEKRS